MSKETNPKEAYGDRKPPFSCLPVPPLLEAGLGMLEGHLKGYRRHNYRVSGVRVSTYYDAVLRHLTAFWEGEDIDSDSGLPHLAKAICCLLVLRDAQMLGKAKDDRPPAYPSGWQEKLIPYVESLRERYPEPVEPYVQESVESRLSKLSSRMPAEVLEVLEDLEDPRVIVEGPHAKDDFPFLSSLLLKYADEGLPSGPVRLLRKDTKRLLVTWEELQEIVLEIRDYQ